MYYEELKIFLFWFLEKYGEAGDALNREDLCDELTWVIL